MFFVSLAALVAAFGAGVFVGYKFVAAWVAKAKAVETVIKS